VKQKSETTDSSETRRFCRMRVDAGDRLRSMAGAVSCKATGAPEEVTRGCT